jgi:hypothetical protein
VVIKRQDGIYSYTTCHRGLLEMHYDQSRSCSHGYELFNMSFYKIAASLLITLCAIQSFGESSLQAAEKQRVPNVVFIMVDDLGKDWISCYGAEGIETIA